MTLDSQQVELIGRAALEAELIRHGFEVARRTATAESMTAAVASLRVMVHFALFLGVPRKAS